LLCLSSIETSFAHLRIDRHSPSIPLFFCFYIAFLKVFLDGPQSMAFLLLALSQSLDFCSKPSPLSINPISVFKISLICPQCRVWSSSGFLFERKYFTRLKMGLQGIIFQEMWKNNKDGLFSFQARSVKTDKFWPHPV